MNILVTGGTGFIGRNLIPHLLKQGHRIFVAGRNRQAIQSTFKENITAYTWDTLNQLDPNTIDAVINLAGKNISESRWSEQVKNDILSSRVNAAKTLTDWCQKAKKYPHIYNASAIGVYGCQPFTDTLPPRLTETWQPAQGYPSDFVSQVGQAWEAALKPAIDLGIAVTFLRFAVVLKHHEGALKKMEPGFYLGLGGKLGTGKQPFSWVHIDDVVNAIDFLIQHPDITGPVNICAPDCVSQKDFAACLATAMHRPAWFTMPARVVTLLFGQMGDELLLQGQHIYPEKLLSAGFTFKYPQLTDALQHEYARNS